MLVKIDWGFIDENVLYIFALLKLTYNRVNHNDIYRNANLKRWLLISRILYTKQSWQQDPALIPKPVQRKTEIAN